MRPLFYKIVKAGLIVGTLDILSAFIHVFIKTGNFIPLAILKFVASGVFGKDAAAGGSMMVLAGLFIHYSIAITFTIAFFLLYPRIKTLSKNKIITGIIYGILVWAIMNLIVLPFTNVSPRPFNMLNAILNIGILIICVGIPLSLMADSFYKNRESAIGQTNTAASVHVS